MWREVTRDHLRSTRVTTLWWAFGLAVYVAVTWAFYPTVRDNPDIAQFAERLPEALRQAFGAEDFLSPGGYAWARMFSLLLPVTLVIYGIRAGVRALVGDEEDGRLELLLAQPVTRGDLLLGRALAVMVNLVLLGMVILVVALIGATLVNADLEVMPLVAATAQVTLLAWALGALGYAVGAATGRSGLAMGVAFGVTLAGYLVHSLSPQVEALQALRVVSPFWYAIGESPFRGDASAMNALVLLLVGVVLVVLAAPGLARRDVGH